MLITIIITGYSFCKNSTKQDENIAAFEKVKHDPVPLEVALREKAIPKDSIILEIRKEFNRIENASLREDRRYYSNPENMEYAWFYGYYDGNELVKLKSSGGEGPYAIDYTFYLKNNQLFFIYIQHFQQDVEEQQERIYFNKGEIIEALIKNGPPPIDELKNMPHNDYLNNIKESSQWFLSLYNRWLKQYESSTPKLP